MSSPRDAFLALWTLAVAATVSAFVLHLALRSKSMQLGYELGKVRQEQGRLREAKRVLELEAASYKTPERVEIVARTLLGMEPPAPERIVSLPAAPGSRLDVATLPQPRPLDRGQANLEPLSALRSAPTADPVPP
jgi:cell division protein FtsL